MITGRRIVQGILLSFFLLPLGFFFYNLPQVAFSGEDFPEDMKMALIVAGGAIGMLWVIKDRRPQPKEDEEEEGDEDNEEDEDGAEDNQAEAEEKESPKGE